MAMLVPVVVTNCGSRLSVAPQSERDEPDLLRGAGGSHIVMGGG